MSAAYLDTHVAIWLHAGKLEKLTNDAKREIEGRSLLISPTVFLELQYLYEIKRVKFPPSKIFADLTGSLGLAMCSLPYPAIAVAATDLAWTRDPFDRLIVAHAMVNHNAKLITADERIRSNYSNAVW